MDPRVTAIGAESLFKNIFGELSGQSGVGDLTGSLLIDSNWSQSFIRMGETLAKNGEVAGLSQVIIALINNGDADSALHFVFDNLVPTSVPLYKKRAPTTGNVSHH